MLIRLSPWSSPSSTSSSSSRTSSTPATTATAASISPPWWFDDWWKVCLGCTVFSFRDECSACPTFIPFPFSDSEHLFAIRVDHRRYDIQQFLAFDEWNLNDGLPRLTFSIRIGGEFSGIVFSNWRCFIG